MDLYGFYTGQMFDAYHYLGAHIEPKGGVTFRTYAPAALKISVLGEFSDWKELPMERSLDKNFWECTVDDAKPGQKYKYRIYRQDHSFLDHCDPYGFGMELRPNTASIIRDLSAYSWKDDKWMKKRTDCKNKPLNIYELHFGSFKKPGEAPADWYSYTEMIDILIPYLKEYGYNYIELMPLSEHPCDESWGYQNTGFFAPTSRYGTATELMEFVDACHENNIGVIIDFVPVHFAVDDYALAKYDGTPLYEYPYPDVSYSEWGSLNFMHSRGETKSFLQSAANYWLNEYHMDGIRMDAISRMIYWQGDEHRGENPAAIDFIRQMNTGLKKLHPSAILSAEDSTAYPNITKPVKDGGLGFDYKWDMGWMNDTLKFFQTDTLFRIHDYHKLTFSMLYFYNEQFILPLSHDETVHGKASILQKMFGGYDNKFPQAKALYMYMYGHPGKKLNFMGNEIGQIREWDEKKEQDWFILKYPNHDSFHQFMKTLNHLYLDHSCLSSKDYELDGFTWLDCHQEARSIYAFERKDEKERIVVVLNLSAQTQEGFEMTVKDSKNKSLHLLLDSNEDIYGGTTHYEKKVPIRIKKEKVTLDLPPFSAFYYLVK